MPKLCRIGDPGSHGGAIITGSPDTFDIGLAVARTGDLYGCTVHGPNPLVTGSPDVYCNDRRVVRVGDLASCGAVMVDGSPVTYVND